MMKAFEHWFGPYPFYEDGYKLVEVPYLGMEHQSSVTYGNKYANGYLGRDLSGTGWGLKWDFIIIHESGHEWFANNITYRDMADMWIHESFTNYSENLFTEYFYGKDAGAEYVIGTRKIIGNREPIIGKYDVNNQGSGDMYPKGGNMLHTIRQIVNDDAQWRSILRGLNQTFYHKTVTTKEIENYVSEHAKYDLSKVFDQYLRDIRIPVLEYKLSKKHIEYRWTNCVAGFDMPVKVVLDSKKELTIYPKTEWQKLKEKRGEALRVDKNFYVTSKEIK
jgi:aminopeptidase N